METVIEFKNVSKKYRVNQLRFHTLRDDIVHFFNRLAAFRSHEDAVIPLWALKDFNCQIQRGESVGLIGANGAGKTTVLKLLSGITAPTEGKIVISGRVASMIEIGAGFHPELTGRENVYQYASIMNMRRRQIDAQFDTIVDFSGIREFIDTPIKRYSSGMYVRLAFAVIAHMDFDILLIDEVLAVGDLNFQKKCLARINHFKESGKTIFFVSHNLTAVHNICERVIFLNKGIIQHDGKPEEVIKSYVQFCAQEEMKETVSRISHPGSQDTSKAKIIGVEVINQSGGAVDTVCSGEKATFRVEVQFNEEIERPIIGVALRNSEGVYIYGINTKWSGAESARTFRKGESARVNFTQNLWLAPGHYYLSLAISDACGSVFYDWREGAKFFKIITEKKFSGLIDLGATITYE